MSFLNLNRQAEGYLNPPADRPRWPDTWTLRRTRGEALGRLLAAYAGWQRTIAGGIAPVLVIGGAYLLGMGLDGDAGWVSIVLTIAGVLIGLVGLLACGVVLVTGLTVVGALRAWAAIRAQDGGPGVRALFTAAGVVRVVLAVLALTGGVWLVLGLLDVVDPVLESPGGRFASWAAAGMGVIAGVVALLGFVLVAAAVRRIPAGKGAGRPAAEPDGGGAAAPGGAPAQGTPPVPPMPGAPGAPGVPTAPQGQAPWAAGPGEPGQGRSAYGAAGYGSLATGAVPPEPAEQAGYGPPAQPFEAGAGASAQQPEAPWQGGYGPSAPAGAEAPTVSRSTALRVDLRSNRPTCAPTWSSRAHRSRGTGHRRRMLYRLRRPSVKRQHPARLLVGRRAD
ncbi:hypothetical protein [Ruania alba]|uniref:hypothetical protein n=1 Tax=Ruania alba TaxID=648782 RepID=UPI000B7CFCEE|nr:hypothetical protein [Ruania alba]